jgi:hypothetical protein
MEQKIHLDTLEDFVAALNKTQADITELLTQDITDAEYEEYIHGDLDDVILTLVTSKMKRDYSFSDEIRDIIGDDDELFQ